MINVIYEDSDMIVVEKPVGIEAQQTHGFQADMVSEIRSYLNKNRVINKLSTFSSANSKMCGEPYVGVIHRLDKPVSGVMVYAKNKRAAAALSAQVKDGRMKKVYQAVLCGKPVDNVDNFVDYLLKDGKDNCSRIVDRAVRDAKRAELRYRVLDTICLEGVMEEGKSALLTLAEVELLTGRHHQIRVQFAGHGLPLWGDNRYNPAFCGGRTRENIALCACKLTLFQPSTGREMTFCMKPAKGAFSYFGKN